MTMNTKRGVRVIIGPTGIGKSDFAIQSALKTGAEIISADAFQVYKGMDIGTAKISPEEQGIVPHHLIDILWPDQPYSIAEFLKRCEQAIQDIRSRNRPVIICGGTGFYIQGFLYGYSLSGNEKSDPHIRQELETLGHEKGSAHLWAMLCAVDPDSAARIKPTDQKKLIRYLEVYVLQKVPPSTLQTRHSTIRSDVTIQGLIAPRSVVVQRIHDRVDAMIEKGLVAEVETLLKTYPKTCHSFEALGYKEVILYLNGSVTQEQMIDLIKVKTRQFAKRQMTWFRKLETTSWTEIFS